MSKMKHKRQHSAFDGPKVLVCHERDGDIFMDALTEDSFHRSAIRVLGGRLSMTGMWYHLDEDEEFRLLANRAISSKNGKAAWELLMFRSDFEHENVELVSISAKYFKGEEE